MKTIEIAKTNLIAEDIQGIVEQTKGITPISVNKGTGIKDIRFMPKSVVLIKTDKDGNITSYLNFGYINNTKIVQTLLKVLENVIPTEFVHAKFNNLLNNTFGTNKSNGKMKNYLADYLKTKVIFVTDKEGVISWAFASADINFSDTLLGVNNHAKLLDTYIGFKAGNIDYQTFKDLCYKTAKLVQSQISLYSVISEEIKQLELFGGYIEQLAELKKQRKAAAAAEAEAAKKAEAEAAEAEAAKIEKFASEISAKNAKKIKKLVEKATKVA